MSMSTVIDVYRRRKFDTCMSTKSTRQLIWHLVQLGNPEPGSYIADCADTIRAEIRRREVTS